MNKIETYKQFERKTNYKDIFDAVSDGNHSELEKYIKQKNDINIQNTNGMSLLMLSIKNDNYYMANLLLDNDIDINLKDNIDGENAIYYTINKSIFSGVNNKFINRLIDMNIDITNNAYFLILHMLIEDKTNISIEILYKIIDNGYDMFTKNHEGENTWEYTDTKIPFYNEKIFNKLKLRYPDKYYHFLVLKKSTKFNL